MEESETIDQTLLIFYRQTKDGGTCSISESIAVNGHVLKRKELELIKKTLESKKLVVFQPEKYGFTGQVTKAGITFVETTSFSTPGKSILT